MSTENLIINNSNSKVPVRPVGSKRLPGLWTWNCFALKRKPPIELCTTLNPSEHIIITNSKQNKSSWPDKSPHEAFYRSRNTKDIVQQTVDDTWLKHVNLCIWCSTHMFSHKRTQKHPYRLHSRQAMENPIIYDKTRARVCVCVCVYTTLPN